jgi:hypothetical protein
VTAEDEDKILWVGTHAFAERWKKNVDKNQEQVSK